MPADRERPRRSERRPRRSKYSVEKGLGQSLDATAEGLDALLASLRRSGLVEGLGGYRTMQAVLLQQKLWALSNRRTAVLPKFRSIARTAKELHRIFSGYASVMDALCKLERVGEQPAEAADANAAASPHDAGPEIAASDDADPAGEPQP